MMNDEWRISGTVERLMNRLNFLKYRAESDEILNVSQFTTHSSNF